MNKSNIVRAVIFKDRATLRESSSFDLRKPEEKEYIKNLFNYFKKLASQNGWGVKLVYVMDQTESEITGWVRIIRELENPSYELDNFDPSKIY